MKNNLSDLNNYLFETLERLMDDDLSPEEMEKEITRSKAVTSVAETMIHNGELALKTMITLNEYRTTGELAPVPKMLDVGDAAHE